ncbi:acryloyl-CoA reductase [Bacteroidetes/Chlorobi group bacterium ChocPot_Mid]|nr:MAG: acryloyl-CoA reductase [Bacteroidetes/Chlorobi group bacterium ChocPot_Mid]
MENLSFKSFVVEVLENAQISRKIKTKTIDELPDGDVLIKVAYSALNYKDALSASGHKGITKKFPHTPGIDASGIVAESKNPHFIQGEKVFVTGYDLGMNTSGGFQEYIRVPSSWVVKLPNNMTLREVMIYGTAGFTAGICINEIQKHDIFPDNSNILVTGATGGVGSLAVGMLKKAGYNITASTGKTEQKNFLKKLGAEEVIFRDDLIDTSNRPLLTGKWNAAIDTVGGRTLSTVIKSIKPRGSVCVLGLVESDRLETTVYPFLLRGINLIGIDSAERPMDYRLNIWKRISEEWKIENTEFLVKEITLEGLEDEINLILKGGQVGKVLIKIS